MQYLSNISYYHDGQLKSRLFRHDTKRTEKQIRDAAKSDALALAQICTGHISIKEDNNYLYIRYSLDNWNMVDRFYLFH